MGKMNMILHGIEKKAFLENADVLTHPAHLDNKGQRIYFDRILANPPFSMNYERDDRLIRILFESALASLKSKTENGD